MMALIIGLVLLAILYFWYAGIISKKNKVLEALSGIDVQLQKRAELIPNILAIAKKFMEHEKNLLENITRLREKLLDGYDKTNAEAVKQHLSMAEELQQNMSGLMVQVENYPDLKSDATMLQAQQTYNEVEAQIAAARRFYNSAVTALNNAVQIFPGNIIAGMVGVSEMPFYDAPESVHAPVNAADHL